MCAGRQSKAQSIVYKLTYLCLKKQLKPIWFYLIFIYKYKEHLQEKTIISSIFGNSCHSNKWHISSVSGFSFDYSLNMWDHTSVATSRPFAYLSYQMFKISSLSRQLLISATQFDASSEQRSLRLSGLHLQQVLSVSWRQSLRKRSPELPHKCNSFI